MSEHQHPAFPVAEDHKVAADLPWTCGLTKREWFAAKAMAALIAEPQWNQDSPTTAYLIGPQTADVAHNYAKAAFVLADAMLEAAAESQPAQYRELQPYEQRRIDAAETLANLVNAAKGMPGWLELPARQRDAIENAVDDVLDPEIPF